MRYELDAYFFVPTQLGIDEQTYPKDRFYSDLRPMIRFREPRLGFKQILGLKKEDFSPLKFLRDFLADLEAGRLSRPVHEAVIEARLFACTFASYLMRHVDRRRKGLAAAERHNDAELALLEREKAEKLVGRATALLKAFRELRVRSEALPVGFMDDVRAEMALVDEYCSYRFRDGMATLLRAFHSSQRLTGGAPAICVEAVRREREEARRRGFLVLHAEAPQSVVESYLHRRGELKRRMWSVLYLHLRVKPTFTIQRQMGAMIAAGLAALWAVIAQVIVIREAALSERMSEFWGISGFLFITAAILAYIVKDRIKEVGRGYFRHGLFRRIPDNYERILFSTPEGQKVVGTYREETRFLKRGDLPQRILEMRDRASDDIHDLGEKIIHYRKSIRLTGNVIRVNRYPVRAIHDILRLNMEPFLVRMSDPQVRVDYVDDDGRPASRYLPKLYFIDLILCHTRRVRRGQDSTQEYLRLILNKEGLVRVERLG